MRIKLKLKTLLLFELKKYWKVYIFILKNKSPLKYEQYLINLNNHLKNYKNKFNNNNKNLLNNFKIKIYKINYNIKLI